MTRSARVRACTLAAVAAVLAVTLAPGQPAVAEPSPVQAPADPDEVAVSSPADGDRGDPVDGVVTPRQVGSSLTLEVSWRVALARDLVVEVSPDEGDRWSEVWRRSFAGGVSDDAVTIPVEPALGGRYRYRARLTSSDADGSAVAAQVAGPVRFTLINRPVTYPSRVVLRRPSASSVRVDAKQVRITGRVLDGAARPGLVHGRRVTLRFAAGKRVWLASTRTRRDGRFTMTVPTYWHYAGRLSASVDQATHDNAGGGEFDAKIFRLAGARSGARPFMRVRNTYRPQGGARWARLDGLRWNPCGGAVTYRINFARAPRGARWHVRQAFRKVSRATGLRFRFLGSTGKVPLYTRTTWPNYDQRADITIAWANGQMFDTFRGGVLGVGGSSGHAQAGYTKGLVQLNSGWNRRMRRGFGRGLTLGTLLLHEIGHAVGLGHAGDRALVMNPSLGSFSWGRYGRGDLIGLRRLGRLQGCWTASGTPRSRARVARTPTWLP